jgi:hypothetical protein
MRRLPSALVCALAVGLGAAGPASAATPGGAAPRAVKHCGSISVAGVRMAVDVQSGAVPCGRAQGVMRRFVATKPVSGPSRTITYGGRAWVCRRTAAAAAPGWRYHCASGRSAVVADRLRGPLR